MTDALFCGQVAAGWLAPAPPLPADRAPPRIPAKHPARPGGRQPGGRHPFITTPAQRACWWPE